MYIPGPLAHGLQSLQHLDLGSVVLVVLIHVVYFSFFVHYGTSLNHLFFVLSDEKTKCFLCMMA